jgi:hypothetical protein
MLCCVCDSSDGFFVDVRSEFVCLCVCAADFAATCLAVQCVRIGRAGNAISLVAAANSVGYHAALCLWQQQSWVWTCALKCGWVCFFFFAVCCPLFSQRCAPVNVAGATISLVATASSVGYHAVLCL